MDIEGQGKVRRRDRVRAINAARKKETTKSYSDERGSFLDIREERDKNKNKGAPLVSGPFLIAAVSALVFFSFLYYIIRIAVRL